MQNTILEKIVRQKKQDLVSIKEIYPLSQIQALIAGDLHQDTQRSFLEALKKNEYPSIIAEIKRASPSKGVLKVDLNPLSLAKEYAGNGARAISVLTEERFFNGSLNDLDIIRKNIEIPIIRKDFIVDEYQIWESKLHKADAILLIAAILEVDEMIRFYKIAQELGLDVLFEAHSEEEIERILPLKPKLIGVNNRNLHTFEVDLNISINLINKYKDTIDTIMWVSESGIYSSSEIQQLMKVGFKGFLIGESLLKANNPGDYLKELAGFKF